jgi:hypothetical protein
MKLGWVIGFAHGWEHGIIDACIQQALLEKTSAQHEWAKTCASNPVLSNPNATAAQMVEGLDHFYADYRNRTINLGFAVSYVYKELNGTPQSTLDELARKLRQQNVNQ